jgi:two-component system chemotaxis sensor kinase CheA
VTLSFDASDAELQLFLEEAAEQIRTLADGLLELERGANDPTIVQALFRAAHTLKGSSATIGHTRMATLTHALENALDALRHGHLEATPSVIDALLASLDALQTLSDEVSTRTPTDLPLDALVERLHAVVAGPAAASENEQARVLSGEEAARVAELVRESGGRPLTVAVTIDPGSVWPAVRAYQALVELSALGTVARSWPSEAELQTGEAGHRLDLILVTDQPEEAVRDAAARVSEVASVEVQPYAAAEKEAYRNADEEATPPDGEERRRIDLGPEMRGAPLEEQLAQAGARLTRLSRMVKVDIAHLDALMNLAGELVIDRGRLVQVLRQLTEQLGGHPALEQLEEITQHLARVGDDLQDTVMLARLLPIESVFNRFPRMVRDLARKSGKNVDFVMEGGDTGLDRSVIDEIGDPLLHLLRNAVDHGVETPEERVAAGKPPRARITLSAQQVENRIVIAVSDDGRGIDPQRMREVAVRKGLLAPDAAARLSDAEAIDLIFMPGFSSKEQVTEVSGRGVGMDIVRTNVERIGGTIDVRTEPGKGTTFSIAMPLTLAIIRALLVRAGESTFTIPLSTVTETLRIRTDAIHAMNGREVVLVRGHTLPLARLAEVFRLPGAAESTARDWCYVVAVRSSGADLGLIVDRLIGEQEVVIKSVASALGRADGIAGATILGDGRVSLIIDVPRIIAGLVECAAGSRAA